MVVSIAARIAARKLAKKLAKRKYYKSQLKSLKTGSTMRLTRRQSSKIQNIEAVD